MEPRTAANAEIELCPDCGGAWIDWLDGDPAALARGLRTRPARRAPAPAVDGTCPVCATPLHAEPLPGGTVVVERCADCTGIFVSADAVARLARSEPPAKGGVVEGAEPPLLTRLLDGLGRLLGG
jgi:Zn-finger nucleic acid-binding protein